MIRVQNKDLSYALGLVEAFLKHCRRCGARLASDHQDDDWCSPCLLSRRSYDPRSDPAFLTDLLLVLTTATGPVEPLKALGIGYEHRQLVRDGIRTLRRRGHVIRATERTAGYVYVGYVPRGHLEGQFTITAAISA